MTGPERATDAGPGAVPDAGTGAVPDAGTDGAPDGTTAALVRWCTGLAPRAGRTRVVAVEGRSGSGKTTLATRLADLTGGELVAMDEIYPGWSGLEPAIPLLVDGVLRPLAAGGRAEVPRWDWASGGPGRSRPLAGSSLVIVEGIGCGARPCARFLSGLMWLEAPAHVRRRRALARDGDLFAPHWDDWAAQEDVYLAVHDPRSRADLVLDAAEDDAPTLSGGRRPAEGRLPGGPSGRPAPDRAPG